MIGLPAIPRIGAGGRSRRRSSPQASADGYTGQLVEQAEREAETGRPAVAPQGTAAVVACAGILARSLALVRPNDDHAETLTPAVLAVIGRELILRGEALFYAMPGRPPCPATLNHLEGGPDPQSWRYSLTAAGPSLAQIVRAPGGAVWHFRHNADPATPWAGRPPWKSAGVAAHALAAIEDALAAEAEIPAGTLLFEPSSGRDQDAEAKKAFTRKLRGKIAMIPTATTGGAAWPTPQRTGGRTDQHTAALDALAGKLAIACGIPPVLITTGAVNAGGMREGQRLLLHNLVAPVCRLIESEVAVKTGIPCDLDTTELFAADINGRARAYRSLVDGGMDPEAAAAICGLDQTGKGKQ